MVKAVVALIGAIILVTAVVFAADAMLRQYGLDLGSLFNILFASISADDSETMSFGEINSTMLGEETYGEIASEKQELEEIFDYAEDMIDELNQDEELTSAMEEALGEHYVVYLYSVVREPVEFKVFEWTIVFDSGEITTFEIGEPTETPNVQIITDHEIIGLLLAQNYTQSDIITWVEEQRIVVTPILEIGRVLQILPTILEMMDLGI
jgi:hypothetical protein